MHDEHKTPEPARWISRNDAGEGSPGWKLYDEMGRARATVWANGTWHTWNEDGVGGENGTTGDAWYAQHEAVKALVRQGWLPASAAQCGTETEMLLVQIRTLVMGVRAMDAYPQSREERLAALLDYCHRIGRVGIPLRAPRNTTGESHEGEGSARPTSKHVEAVTLQGAAASVSHRIGTDETSGSEPNGVSELPETPQRDETAGEGDSPVVPTAPIAADNLRALIGKAADTIESLASTCDTEDLLDDEETDELRAWVAELRTAAASAEEFDADSDDEEDGQPGFCDSCGVDVDDVFVVGDQVLCERCAWSAEQSAPPPPAAARPAEQLVCSECGHHASSGVLGGLCPRNNQKIDALWISCPGTLRANAATPDAVAQVNEYLAATADMRARLESQRELPPGFLQQEMRATPHAASGAEQAP